MSLYEKRFGTVQRGRGRPQGVDAKQFVFVSEGKIERLAKLARQRALAIVMDENRDRLRDLFEDEYRHLVDVDGAKARRRDG